MSLGRNMGFKDNEDDVQKLVNEYIALQAINLLNTNATSHSFLKPK